ncbi:uncharacterized protein [Coffea arabica]|uniref:Uncharacterized protein n=1 Tax=Coffea arabica TaxID=13443 RepID=A0ABM4VPE3_COFAR
MQDAEDIQEIQPPPTTEVSKGKKVLQQHKKGKTIGTFFMPRATPGGQPSIKSVMQSKEAKEKVDMVVAKWMIDASIPFNAANSAYYQTMFDAACSFGAGYKAPNFYDLRGYLLTKNVEQVKNFVNSFRTTWKETGCTIMADGWTDQQRRTLINFLAYCPRGTVFLKSVDALDASKTAEMLYKLFREVVLFVGVQNVVHFVTDNAANYVAAGRLLEREFPTLYWSPCAAHCLNLMLHDMGKLDEVSKVVGHASKITKYIYNHCYPLHLMRKHTGGREIIRPAPTRFATNFIALQSILVQKDALRAMVTSKEWTLSAYAKESKAKKFVDLVLDSIFWKECAIIVQLTEPLVRVLRIVDSDERPAMGYLYAAMHRAREELWRRFTRKKKAVDPYLRIIDSRWDSQLHKNLHAAGYWLNPAYQYNSLDLEKHRHATSGLLDVIETYSYANPDLMSNLTGEMRLFRKAEGDFGRVSAIRDRDVMLPDEWWTCYGSTAPNLQKLAIRVLSQTCSASGCERNWSLFEHIHSKKRNRLEHQRLNDLVYVHYNLRLQQRNARGRNYDPIDFEDFSVNETWILDDEPSQLTPVELESFRNEIATFAISRQSDETLNLDDLDTRDEDETNNEENVERNDLNVGCDVNELGGTEFGRSWEPWA